MLLNLLLITSESYPFMMCNEANLKLLLFLKHKIVVSEHNELAVVTQPSGHLRVGSMGEHVCGYLLYKAGYFKH